MLRLHARQYRCTLASCSASGLPLAIHCNPFAFFVCNRRLGPLGEEQLIACFTRVTVSAARIVHMLLWGRQLFLFESSTNILARHWCQWILSPMPGVSGPTVASPEQNTQRALPIGFRGSAALAFVSTMSACVWESRCWVIVPSAHGMPSNVQLTDVCRIRRTSHGDTQRLGAGGAPSGVAREDA